MPFSSVAVQTAITCAINASSSSHNSTTDIQAIQTAFNAMMSDLVWGQASAQTVKEPAKRDATATFNSGTPWPNLT